MENVQRSVMLLKPDTHIAGQWQGGMTLRLNAMSDGVVLSLQGGKDSGTGCNLTLFLRDGSFIAAGELNGAVFQAKVSGVHLEDITGAAIICGDRFMLKSSGIDWPEVIGRYRFAHAHSTAMPPEPQPVEAEIAPDTDIKTPTAAEPMPEEPPVAAVTEDNNTAEAVPPQENETPQQQPPQESEEPCPGGIRQSPVDPFPGVFPGSEWVKISYPGPAGWWHYIFGRARVDGCDADVVGVPGDYSMAPPAWLDGFSTYVRCSSGDARGYWLMFQDPQTGRVLDISRFRHGG